MLEFQNREISWLAFNERVLQEAADPTVPLIERLHFLGIFSSNLDEFFRVRVATVRRMQGFGKVAKNILNTKPKKLLRELNTIVKEQQTKFAAIYNEVKLALHEEGICIINESQLSDDQKEFLENYFNEVVQPRLVPIMLNYIDKFPELPDNSIHLAIKLHKEEDPIYSLIEIPDTLNRFVVMPCIKGKEQIIFLDDVIRLHLDTIFFQFEYKKAKAYTIKLTRDAELDMDADISKSLIVKLSEGIEHRKRGAPVRFIYDKTIDEDLLDFLISKMDLSFNENNIAGGKHHNFKDFMGFPTLDKKKHLENPRVKPLRNKNFSDKELIFDTIARKDILVHYPYQKFSYLNDLLRAAAIDPYVTTIKMTLYRVAKYSSVANSLINAAKNGKKVVAVVELQARFDEESNIYWAKKMQEAGVQLIYGVPHLKVHAKMCLVTRIYEGKRTRFANFSTGNFNEKTALIYSDMSLFTSKDELTYEANKVFQFLEMNYKNYDYQHLMISPKTNRSGFEALIDNEIEAAKKGKPASIFVKMNSLVDQDMVSKLYEASNAGVKIRMIVRGICVLIPGIKGSSENIEIISIVDKFLEHARVFIFNNNGKPKIYLSSADWMKRNLDYRVEVSFPILDKDIRKEITDFMELQWEDNTKARIIDSEFSNTYRKNGKAKKVRAQIEFYEYLKNKK